MLQYKSDFWDRTKIIIMKESANGINGILLLCIVYYVTIENGITYKERGSRHNGC